MLLFTHAYLDISQHYFEKCNGTDVLCGLILFAGVFNFAFYILYWIVHSKKLRKGRGQIKSKSINGVSLVIASHNNLSHLQDNFPDWITQDIESLEIIIVDDRSEDGTREWLHELSKKYAQLKVISVNSHDNPNGGKKTPLSKGIKAAVYPNIVLTDADCSPTSNHWLSLMVAPLKEFETAIVIGGAPLRPNQSKTSVLGSIESILIMLQYMSWAFLKKPYMGVGRNMSFTKGTFEALRGFEHHSHLLSGDDDLLVLQARKQRIPIIPIMDPGALMISPAKDQLKEYIRQKQRHHSVATQYPWNVQIHLALFGGSQLIWGVGFWSGLILGWWIPFVLLMLLRFGTLYRLYSSWSKDLPFKFSGLYYVCFDIVYSWMLLIHALLWRKPVKKW